MIEFLVDNIYVRFGGQLFRQTVGIPMGTNCAPLLLADLFLCFYENEFLDKLIKEGKRKLPRKFIFSYRYMDDHISFSNKRSKEFVSDIYPKELTISETKESTSVASDLHLLFTRDENNNITTKLYDNISAHSLCLLLLKLFLLFITTLMTSVCRRVTKLIICPTHLRNSMAEALIWLDNTRKKGLSNVC